VEVETDPKVHVEATDCLLAALREPTDNILV